MWFDFGRIERFPTQYPPNKTPVTVDVLEAGLIFSFVILAVSFYVIFFGLRGKRFLAVFSRTTISLILGAIIIVGNFGQEWEVGHIKTKTAYRAGTGQEIEADIGVKIGFRSVNVTLKADTPPNTDLKNEVIDYNERFDWTWDQGRFGFGPYAGHLQRSFREGQYKGLPLPILWVVDYFVFDGEGLRFGRFYRTAGWYAHICVWTAFACWILSNILFQSVIRYGAFFLGVSGILQLLSCLIWGVVRNPFDLDIPFEAGSIKTKYGSSFYVTLVGGIISCSLAIAIHICNMFWPDESSTFFGIDPLSDYDELHLTQAEAILLRDKSGNSNTIQMRDMATDDSQPEYDDVVIFKRRSSTRFGLKKSLKHNKNIDEEPLALYSNLPASLPPVQEDYPAEASTSGRQRLPPLPPRRRN